MLPETASGYDFDGSLPDSFKASKPIEKGKYLETLIHDLAKENKLRITRKEDGWKVIVIRDANGQIRIFTDGLNEVEDFKIAHLKKELGGLSKKRFPNRSLILSEIVANGETDDRGRIVSLMKATRDTTESLFATGPPPCLRVFNVVFWNGILFDRAYDEVHFVINRMTVGLKYIRPVEILNCGFDRAKEIVKERGWEGLVLYDRDFRITFRIDGKTTPERPWGSWKWKPTEEGDFFAVGCRMRDKDPAVIKDLIVCQIDPTNNRAFRCSHFGNLTKAERARFSTLPMRITKKNNAERWFNKPFVVYLEYDRRFRKSGKLENPQKGKDNDELLIREDKTPGECYAPQSYPEAEYLN